MTTISIKKLKALVKDAEKKFKENPTKQLLTYDVEYNDEVYKVNIARQEITVGGVV